MSQALYRKWRPRLWNQVVGQEHVILTLQNAVRSGRIGHAYLFAGPRGTGKTTTARLLAKAVNCLASEPANRPCNQCEPCKAVNEGRFLDIIEIDAASNTSVDDVRELRDKINFSPSQGHYKVYIIDEIHMLSTAAFNALLKTLEEPPPHAIFILATTEVHKIPPTVLSRCQRHEFRRIPVNTIVEQLKEICEQEKLIAQPEALTLIARQSTGSMRDAISLLDQLSSTGEEITLAIAQTILGTATNFLVIELVNAILAHQASSGLDCIGKALDSGSDPRQFARQVVDYLRCVLLIQMDNADQVDATTEVRAQMNTHAKAFDLTHLRETLRLFNTAASEIRTGWQPALLLELALVEAVEKTTPSNIPINSTPTQSLPTSLITAIKTPTQSEVKSGPETKPPVQQETVQQNSSPLASTSPSPASQASQQTSTTSTPGISLQEIVQNWTRIRTIIKKNRSQTEGLLNSCKPLGIKDGALVLGFASEVLKTKMELPDNLELTRKAIAQVIGVQIAIICVVMNAKVGTSQVDPDVDGEGMVGTALNLGGQITHKE